MLEHALAAEDTQLLDTIRDMSKEDLLSYLSESQGAAAARVARDLAVSYPAAAMALLRLARQGLVERFMDPARGIYWYRLTERGAERLAYLGSEN